MRRLWYVCGWDPEDVGRCGEEWSGWEGGLPSEELLRGVWYAWGWEERRRRISSSYSLSLAAVCDRVSGGVLVCKGWAGRRGGRDSFCLMCRHAISFMLCLCV